MGKGSEGKPCVNCETETAETETEHEPETALMEIESSVHASMSRCKGEFCEAAYHYAFDLYKIAHNNAKHDFDDFSAEKKSLLSSALLFPNLLNVKKVAYLT